MTMKPALAMDTAAIRTAQKAGQSAPIFAKLAQLGILRFADDFAGKPGFFACDTAEIEIKPKGDGSGLACDAQPELMTNVNAGIPAWLANYFDPSAIEILVAPVKAVEILGGEVQYGDWTTDTATFVTIEYVGEVSSYGDYNTNGMNSVNLNFPQRQSYHFQTFTQWGEKQLAKAALARVDYASGVNKASLMNIAQFFNSSYFFGISGLQNYGLLNDPALSASLVSSAKWSTLGAVAIYNEIRRLFTQIQYQSNGTIDAQAAVTLAMSPVLSIALTTTNEFGKTVYDLLKQSFPNIRFETAVQYGQQFGGELVQMIVTEVMGVRTATPAFTEKLRAHAVVVGASSWSQKKSAGTFGTVIKNYTAIASMIGA
jgi:hypothetical protein